MSTHFRVLDLLQFMDVPAHQTLMGTKALHKLIAMKKYIEEFCDKQLYKIKNCVEAETIPIE